MRSKTIVITLLCWLFCRSAHAQTASSQPTSDAQSVESEEADIQSVESEEADAEVVNVPLLYTMTGGVFTTSGRVLLNSTKNSAVASILNRDQAEKSGLMEVPMSYRLQQNYPNPFNPTTTIRFELPEASIVTLKIYNTLGQEVTELIHSGLMDKGTQDVQFDAKSFASGIYYYRISANGVATGKTFTQVKNMVLLR